MKYQNSGLSWNWDSDSNEVGWPEIVFFQTTTPPFGESGFGWNSDGWFLVR